MRRIFSILLFAALSHFSVCAQVDTLQLGGLLKEYVAALDRHPLSEKYLECDFIISACPSSETKAFTLEWLFKYFSTSKNMDDENVAVYLVDRYGLDDFNAKIFAASNRDCLLGVRAKEIPLEQGLVSKGLGKYHVLFFYDKSCAKCKVEEAQLDEYWAANGAYNSLLTKIDVEGLADSTLVQYCLFSTPKMFLLDPHGVIIGRKLDVQALRKLQSAYNPYAYSKEYSTLCSRLLDGGYEDFDDVCESLYSLGKDTTDMGRLTAKKMIFNVQNYIMMDERGDARHAYNKLVTKTILPLGGDFWNVPKDSIEIVYLALLFEKLYALAPVGSRLPKVKVVLKDGSVQKLDKIKNAYVVFGDSMCGGCIEKVRQLEALIGETAGAKKKVRLVVVYMDSQSKDVQNILMEKLDLSMIPFVVYINNVGRIEKKYL